ncbi:hypothetical protein GUJ93_ZPchr0006g41196 [Zizania palustris]|uniref:Uncharacterized protein n=1 Tax=Zizania palustris TaxID=103762 RepID=A0A8J5W338_ZIZPA|nr:hypothetical protein GUJ93_ZPchr0006g41196 [Zizania palustris]
MGHQKDNDTFMEDKELGLNKDGSSDSGPEKRTDVPKSGKKPQDDLEFEGESDGMSEDDALSKIPACYFNPGSEKGCVEPNHLPGLVSRDCTSEGGDKVSRGDELVVFDAGSGGTVSMSHMSCCDGKEKLMEGESVEAEDTQGEVHVVETEVVGTRKKKSTRVIKKKPPTVAIRQSARIKHDGIPITVKAQNRADRKNDVSGISQFCVMNSVSNDYLKQIAVDVGIELGGSDSEVDANISLIKAQELAHAQLCALQRKKKDSGDGVEVTIVKEVERGTIKDGGNTGAEEVGGEVSFSVS